MASPLSALLTFILFTILVDSYSAFDRLSLGESISSNQTLTSSTGTFVLGFFSPTNSTNSYLGIWRSGSSPLTSVWIANRASPVPLHRAAFRLTNTANLQVSDSNGTILWSSNTPLPPPSNTTIALLLDTGNLVVRANQEGTILWQAFDHPTDTVLPGMPIWANYRTHQATSATSWRSPVDPSPGEFSTCIDPDTRFQGIIKRGQSKWFRTNLWDGASYTTRGNSSVVPFLSFSLSPDSWNLYFSSSVQSGAMAVRLEHNGTAQVRLWIPGLNVWRPFYTFNSQLCDTYGLCGTNGYCSSEPPTCRCLDGFEARNRSEWDGEDYRGGCVRSNALVCDGRDQFVSFQKMKLPDYNVYLQEVGNGSVCAEICRSNCSCVAYAYTDLWTGTETVPRCLVWFDDLIDLVARNDTSGEVLYVRVRMADSGGADHKKDNKVVIILPVILGAAFLVALVCFICMHKKCLDRSKKKEEQYLNGFSTDIEQGLQDLPLLDYEIIVSATDNFSDLNKIGQGGFGYVYKGKLPGGPEVAIKRLSEESGQGLVEFKNEIALIAKLQHRNLVKLLNCCIYGEERLLVYEYMPNRSLELYLFDSEKERILDWEKRFNIIKAIAKGLLYLHEDSRLKIIHRDLKASNVLLDEDMNAKISDFGMARIFDNTQNQANTRRIVGTYGYMSPEYAMEGVFSTKSDVYSFGVLLLEIITGQRNTSFRSNPEFPSLLSYAWESWDSGNVMKILAPSIRDHFSLSEVEKCVHIGLLCVQDDHTNRPNMSSVFFMLENQTTKSSKPEKPTFTGWLLEDDSFQQHAFASNNLTMSVLEGR